MRHARNIAALVIVLCALAMAAHLACGCYGPGEGPPCSALDGVCGDPPATHHDAGRD